MDCVAFVVVSRYTCRGTCLALVDARCGMTVAAALWRDKKWGVINSASRQQWAL